MTENYLDGRKSADLLVYAELTQRVNHSEHYMFVPLWHVWFQFISSHTACDDFHELSCDFKSVGVSWLVLFPECFETTT